ncbi:hypothetical protein VTJ83DRAFT_6022 [Remersonia thermophila]|uniref:Rhodopsin domain-containing protein n=1 Tax=Remersonia thermophila TaxID=72144 RepID=A0ABR4D989_9PEZI
MASVEDYGPQLIATIWPLAGGAALFLALRIGCKVLRRRLVGWDDYVLVASWCALATSCALLTVITTIGYGRHNADIPAEHFATVLLVSYVAGFFSILAACWSKISFAITLLRIAATSRFLTRLLWVIIIVVNIVFAGNATAHFAQCWPPPRLWQPGAEGKCWPRIAVIRLNIAVAAFSGSIDILLALLPWFIVWNAAISRREKLSALFASSMGVFAGITSFLKIRTIDAAIGSKDIVDSVNLLIYGTAESAVTIVAVSIPILRALLFLAAEKEKDIEFGPVLSPLQSPPPTQQKPLSASYQLPMPDVSPFSIEEGLGSPRPGKDKRSLSSSTVEFDFGVYNSGVKA